MSKNQLQYWCIAPDGQRWAGESYDWDINLDAVSGETSTITTTDGQPVIEGSLIVVKIRLLDRSSIIITGVVDGFESNKISMSDINRLFDNEIYLHKYMRVNDFSGWAVSNLITHFPQIYTFNATSNSSRWYYANEKPKGMSGKEILEDAFVKNRCRIRVGSIDASTWEPKLEIGVSNEHLQFKDNLGDISNWKVDIKQQKSDYNQVDIYGGNDRIEYQFTKSYYIDIRGDIVETPTNARHPIKSKISLIDTSETDSDSPLERAQSVLSLSQYSHSIQFDLLLTSSIFDFDFLNQIGCSVDIFYMGIRYPSILSGWELKSDSNSVTLKFGNQRSKFATTFVTKK